MKAINGGYKEQPVTVVGDIAVTIVPCVRGWRSRVCHKHFVRNHRTRIIQTFRDMAEDGEEVTTPPEAPAYIGNFM